MLIRTKLTYGLGSLVLLLALNATFSLYIISQYTTSVEDITTIRTRRERLLTKEQFLINELRLVVLESLNFPPKNINSSLASLDKKAKHFYESLDELKNDKHVNNNSLHNLFRSFQAYYIFGKRMLRRAQTHKLSKDSTDHFRKMQKDLSQNLSLFHNALNTSLDTQLTQKKNELIHIKKASIVFFCLIFLGIIYVTYMTSRSFLGPLTSLSQVVNAFEQGDTSVRVAVKSADEIGKIGHTFNKISESLEKREKSLSQAKRDFKSMFENAWDGMGRASLDGKIILASPGMATIMGFSSVEELLNVDINVGHLYVHEGTRALLLQRLKNGESPVELETEFRKNTGEIFWGRMRCCLCKDETGQTIGIDTFLTDITAQKHEHELSIAKEAAEAANEAKSDFLATMSHEIRTPLHALLGIIDVLEQKNPSTKLKPHFTTLQAVGSQLSDIVNNILDYSKLESGKLSMESTEINLRDIADEMDALFEHICKEQQIKCSCNLAPEVHVNRLGDPTRLKQIIANLLNNATKFTHAGSIELSITPCTPAEDDLGVLFAVKDTGIGIPHDRQKNIFEKFSQADNSVSRKYGGSGLGLAICKQLVEAMNGKIWLESEPEKGATFFVQLNLEKNHAPRTKATPETKPLPPQKLLQGTRILIAEDFEPNNALMQLFLEGTGAELEFVFDGQAAYEKASTQKYSIILMDVEMPNMDGLNATRMIRKHEEHLQMPAIPIISLTAHTFDNFMNKCRNAGCTDYLSKPFKKQELLNIILKHTSQNTAEYSDNIIDNISKNQTPTKDHPVIVQKTLQEAIPELKTNVMDRILLSYQHIENNDKQSLLQLAHTMKGTLGLYGFKWMAEEWKELEKIIGVEEYDIAKNKLQSMKEYMQHVKIVYN